MSKRTITVIPGDGIGPSIIDSALKILDKAGCNFEYEFAENRIKYISNNFFIIS